MFISITCCFPVLSLLSVPGEKEKNRIHGSMYDSVEITLARKKVYGHRGFVGSMMKL